MPGRLVRKSTYEREYHELIQKDGIPFVPDAVWKDAIFAAAIMLAVIACAFFFGPFGPTGQPDPTIIQTAPKPDFAFLWIYAVLAFLPPSLETPFLLIVPVVVIGALLLLPLVAGEGEKHWSRRPVAVLMVALIAVTLGVFTRLGTYTPWSPIMDAWTSDPVPAQYLHGRTPLERQGALVLQEKQCRNCHSLGGLGGLRGPALDSIAARMTEDQITRQVLQGGGNMPSYGNALNPAETTALVHFLLTLRGQDLTPAVDASRRLTQHVSRALNPSSPSGRSRQCSRLRSFSPRAYICEAGSLSGKLGRRNLPLLRLSCFLLGLAVLWMAVASPLDGFADVLLSAHMVQHLLLMSVVPPLLLLGWPVVPLLRGLPAWILRPVLGPLLRSRRAAPPGALADFAAGSVARDEPDLPWLACARGLRFCAHTRTLARFRARLFSRKLTRILVVRHPAMADPERTEQLGIVVVPAFGGPREHGSLRLPRVL